MHSEAGASQVLAAESAGALIAGHIATVLYEQGTVQAMSISDSKACISLQAIPCRVAKGLRAHLQGTSYGAPCKLENVLARIVIDRVPSIEMVRFVNSGTEACLSVLRLMRAYTKRDKVSGLYTLRFRYGFLLNFVM